MNKIEEAPAIQQQRSSTSTTQTDNQTFQPHIKMESQKITARNSATKIRNNLEYGRNFNIATSVERAIERQGQGVKYQFRHQVENQAMNNEQDAGIISKYSKNDIREAQNQ